MVRSRINAVLQQLNRRRVETHRTLTAPEEANKTTALDKANIQTSK